MYVRTTYAYPRTLLSNKAIVQSKIHLYEGGGGFSKATSIAKWPLQQQQQQAAQVCFGDGSKALGPIHRRDFRNFIGSRAWHARPDAVCDRKCIFELEFLLFFGNASTGVHLSLLVCHCTGHWSCKFLISTFFAPPLRRSRKAQSNQR